MKTVFPLPLAPIIRLHMPVSSTAETSSRMTLLLKDFFMFFNQNFQNFATLSHFGQKLARGGGANWRPLPRSGYVAQNSRYNFSFDIVCFHRLGHQKLPDQGRERSRPIWQVRQLEAAGSIPLPPFFAFLHKIKKFFLQKHSS